MISLNYTDFAKETHRRSGPGRERRHRM